jgi:phenylacetic acid degradation operon negative regulatory protein
MPDRVLQPRSGSSAKALLLTVLGEFALPHDGALWTSTIVDGLGLLDVSERNARQAVARLHEQGIVEPERHGRRTRWHLTEPGHKLLAAGRDRIYQFGGAGAAWDGQWLVVMTSVPEDQRAKRHQLRSQLQFAGFGFIAPGIAVTPHIDRERAASSIIDDLDLDAGAVVWLARTGRLVPDDEIIRRGWDLAALASRYADFVGEFERRLPRSPAARFGSVVELVHAWRRFPFGDPEIPDSLLPPSWPGLRAKQLFDARHAAWTGAAHEWFEKAEAAEDGR